jgi:YD repeat-containing protein
VTDTSSPCQEVDANGNVTKRVFDPMGRVTSVTDGAGNVTQTAYDGDGLVTKTIDARGNYVINSYLKNHLSSVTDPVNTVGYGYDARGNRASVQESLQCLASH